uniref:Transcription factor jun-D n=2 Tax=Hydra vulgaris TaxID=6087 RepID=T2MGT1_HYDVU
MSQVAFYDRLVMSQQNYDKSALSLNLNGGRSAVSSRKRKFLQPSAALLQSPDLKLLKLGSPELEKLIIQNNGFIPTPTIGNTSFSQVGDHVEDQESFARGFIEALQKLQQENDVKDSPLTKAWNFSRISNLNQTAISSSLPTYQQITASNSLPNVSKWGQVDHNLNTVPVITANGNHYDNQSQLNSIKYSTATSVDVASTIGLDSLPKSNYYISKSQQCNIERTSHSKINSDLYPPSNNSLVSEIKTEDDMPPSVGSSTSSVNLEMNPIDLDAQEHIKHQRKKLRNRLAAQRCRKRKIEREETLKLKVKELKNKNSELTNLASKLRMQVCELKQQVMHHVNEGCQVFYKDADLDS